MPDLPDLRIAAQWADAQALVGYDAYVRAHDRKALREAAVHAHEAVNALMRATATPPTAALQLIERELPGVRAVMHGAAEKLASDAASRLRAVWVLLQLHSPSPVLDDEERRAVLRLLVAALVSDDFEVLDISGRVTRIPHRRVASVLLIQLGRSEQPWKAALSPTEYRHLVHRYAPRSGPGRGRLCTAFSRVGDKDYVTSMLAMWLDSGGQRDALYGCLDATLAASFPAVLV